ncbi:GlxA family transcriptional regulator [Labrys okinawensis]|uniref:GlxA family transcriptional regulator n=1 Tax=Labrys okinawensis TaxID=346911 RepID=UPI001FE16CE7|nr:helix-turn-helix domain-containing protein [Labrys okinawensis]
MEDKLTSFSAKTSPRSPREVVILVTEDAITLDAAGPIQAFHEVGLRYKDRAYQITVASPYGGVIPLDSGIRLESNCIFDLSAEKIDTLLVVSSYKFLNYTDDSALIGWLRKIKTRIRRIGSLSMGTFLLAEAGLLDGVDVVTHWKWRAPMTKHFSSMTVLSNCLYLRSGNIWTSAGMTSGIDMALAMIEEDHGRALALDVARTLLVFMHRPGGQAQISIPLAAQSRDIDSRFGALHDWIITNLSRRLDIEVLSDWMGMSPRTFARQYKEAVGDTPAKVIRRMRIEVARSLLEKTSNSISSIAIQCGFSDVENMRRAFLKDGQLGPAEYRERFAGSMRAD